jgi:peroxiredoxin
MYLNMNRLFLAAALAVTIASPKIGQRAPDFTLRNQNGVRVSLSSARGQKTVLVFYRGYW